MNNAILARVTAISLLLIAGSTFTDAYKVAPPTFLLNFPLIVDFEDTAKHEKSGTYVMDFSDPVLRDSRCVGALHSMQNETVDHQDHFQPLLITDAGVYDAKQVAEIQNGLSNVLVFAEHLTSAATTQVAAKLVFNAIFGEILRWKWLWPQLAGYSGVGTTHYPEHPQALDLSIARAASDWEGIARIHNLVPNPISRVATFWHSDANPNRHVGSFTDMERS